MKMVHKHKLKPKILFLEHTTDDELKPFQKNLVEKYDKKLTALMKAAKKQCRHLFMGNVPYSRAFKKIKSLRHFWMTILQRKQGRKIRMHTISRRQKKNKIKGRPWTKVLLKSRRY